MSAEGGHVTLGCGAEIPLRIETQEGSLQQQTTVMRYNDERRQLIFAVRAILRLCK